jgi:hypothetical protein
MGTITTPIAFRAPSVPDLLSFTRGADGDLGNLSVALHTYIELRAVHVFIQWAFSVYSGVKSPCTLLPFCPRHTALPPWAAIMFQ